MFHNETSHNQQPDNPHDRGDSHSQLMRTLARVSTLLFGRNAPNAQNNPDSDVCLSIDDDGTGTMMRGQQQLSGCEAWAAFNRMENLPTDIGVDLGDCSGCRICSAKLGLD